MTRAAPPTRRALCWPLWLFAAALLLKAAMPWLAGEAAVWQGKTAFQICSVHGVSLAAADASVADDGSASHRNDDSDDAPSSQHTDHCALGAIGTLATAAAPVTSPSPSAMGEAGALRTHAPSQAPDACGAWIARLKHGPPDIA